MAEQYFTKRLHRCIILNKNTEVLSILQGENLCHLADANESTLLHYAAKYGNKYLVRHLIALGANVDAQNREGETPLMLAVKRRHEDVVKLLLKANADLCVPDARGKCVLGRALNKSELIRGGSRELILNSVTTEYLRKSPYVKTKAFHEDCPLYRIALLKNCELTRLFLENGSPVDVKHPVTGETALHEAVKNLDVEFVELLLKHGANANAKDRGRQRPVALLPRRDDDDEDKKIRIIENLTSTGVELFDRDDSEDWWQSVLSHGSKRIVRAVLQCSTGLYAKNGYSRRPIDYLLDNKNPGVHEEMKNFKINFDVCFGDKTAMLHRAAATGNACLVQLLIEHGANVNVKDKYNRSPLLMAVDPRESYFDGKSRDRNWASLFNSVSLLLENGADPVILTKDVNHKCFAHFDRPAFKNLVTESMRLVLIYLALHEASGRAIDRFMLSEIEKRQQFKTIFDTSKRQLEEAKRIKIDEAASLFDFLTAEKISVYVNDKAFAANLNSAMKEYRLDGYCTYYYLVLQRRVLKLNRLIAVNEVFVEFYNVSVVDIVEKIIDYV